MAHLVISLHRSQAFITASHDIEPPMVDSLHSVGGGIGVPAHDRGAHAGGRPHECTRVRSARQYIGTVRDRREVRNALAAQYAAHEIEWRGWE